MALRRLKGYPLPVSSLLVAIIVLTSLLGGCAGQATPPAAKEAPKAQVQDTTPKPSTNAAQTPVTMKVAWTPTMSFAAFYVAMDKGYFKDAGINIEPETFKSAQDSIAFLAKGDIQAVLGAPSAGSLNGFHDGMDIRVVSSVTYINKDYPALCLVVRKDLLDSGKVKDVKDLKGLKVAVTGQGVTSEYWIVKALEKAGLTFKDVEFVYMGYPEMVVALTNKAIDAAQLTPPNDTKAETLGVGKITLRDPGAEILNTVLYYNGKFIKDQPEVAKKFLTTLLKTTREIYGKNFLKDEYVKIYSKWTKVSEEDIKKSAMYFYDPNGRISPTALADQQSVWIKMGYLKYTTPLDLSKYVDNSILDASLKDLREFKP